MNELKKQIAPFKLSDFRWNFDDDNYIVGRTVAQKKFSSFIQEKIVEDKWMFFMYETYIKIIKDNIELIFKY